MGQSCKMFYRFSFLCFVPSEGNKQRDMFSVLSWGHPGGRMEVCWGGGEGGIFRFCRLFFCRHQHTSVMAYTSNSKATASDSLTTLPSNKMTTVWSHNRWIFNIGTHLVEVCHRLFEKLLKTLEDFPVEMNLHVKFSMQCKKVDRPTKTHLRGPC